MTTKRSIIHLLAEPNSPHTASCHKWEVIAEESLPFITTGEEITLIFDYPHYSTKYAACIGGETRI